MAQLFSVNIYKVGSGTQIPPGTAQTMLFPFAGVMVQGVTAPNYLPDPGVYLYSKIIPLATLSQNPPANALAYYTNLTPTEIQALDV